MMKKISLCGFFFFFMVSCSSQNRDLKLRLSLEKIIQQSKEDGRSYYMYDYLFVNKRDNVIAFFDIDGLRRLYFGKHILESENSISFEMFIREVIDNQIQLECKYFLGCFELDSEIEKEYFSIGFVEFQKKYSEEVLYSKKIALRVTDLSKEEVLSVMYFFYLNAYLTVWADYEGYYFTRKILTEEIINPNEGLKIELLED